MSADERELLLAATREVGVARGAAAPSVRFGEEDEVGTILIEQCAQSSRDRFVLAGISPARDVEQDDDKRTGSRKKICRL